MQVVHTGKYVKLEEKYTNTITFFHFHLPEKSLRMSGHRVRREKVSHAAKV